MKKVIKQTLAAALVLMGFVSFSSFADESVNTMNQGQDEVPQGDQQNGDGEQPADPTQTGY